jgi:hypothetical protein
LRDPLELLPGRISGRKMRPHVPEQARHLTKEVSGRREIKKMSFRSIEVAQAAFEERPIPENVEPLRRVEFCPPSRLPGCLKMAADSTRQNLIVLPRLLVIS